MCRAPRHEYFRKIGGSLNRTRTYISRLSGARPTFGRPDHEIVCPFCPHGGVSTDSGVDKSVWGLDPLSLLYQIQTTL